MNNEEQVFNINTLLIRLFNSLQSIKNEHHITLIYDMESTLPRELRGGCEVLFKLLLETLTFVFKQIDNDEIVLSLGAPEDFLFEEFVTFKIKDTNINKEQLRVFLESHIQKELEEKLGGKIVYDTMHDVHIEVPFKLHELGYRRHYRLPYNKMLGKKVLILSQSVKQTHVIANMLRYFLYEVDVGLETYRHHGNNLASYDIVIVDQELSSEELHKMVFEVQKNVPLKYVIFQESHMPKMDFIPCVTTHLVKPVTQESIFELIVSLYKNDEVDKKSEIKYSVDLEHYFHTEQEGQKQTKTVLNDSIPSMTSQDTFETHKKAILLVLDKEEGLRNCKQKHLDYKSELKIFLDAFERSDFFFKQIVNEEAMNKIKLFCADLEAHSKIIGAQGMLQFIESLNLVITYNKLEALVIYPGRYHLELEKLILEIKKELHIKTD